VGHPNNEFINRPCVSIVMPCYNARETIAISLDAIFRQQVDFEYEVVIVDSSDDGTDQIIRSRFPQVRLIHLDQLEMPGSKRNLGVRHARGEIVAFTDSDCLPDYDWLKQMVTYHQKIDADGIGGCVINGYPGSLATWVSHLIEFSEWTERTSEGYVRNNPSCNLSFKREIFQKLGVFFTDAFPTEDTLFNWTVHEKGGKIFFTPKARVVHMKRVKIRKLLSYQLVMGKAAGEVRRTSNLPGKIFTKYPVLCLGLPFIRWLRASLRFARNDLKTLFLFWLLTPFYLAATEAWSIGFMTRGKGLAAPRYYVEGPILDPSGLPEQV
jgi:glycosyltransferase involved in cell wall biosynthesis